jgi:hypothetical protein
MYPWRMAELGLDRQQIAQRGKRLEYFTKAVSRFVPIRQESAAYPVLLTFKRLQPLVGSLDRILGIPAFRVPARLVSSKLCGGDDALSAY